MRFADAAVHRAALLPLLLGACATPGGLSRSGQEQDQVRLLGRVLASADARRIDLPLLDSALAHPSADVRRVAASATGNLRAVSLAPRLAERAADADREVAREAAFALALLRDTASAGRLDSLLDSPRSDVARGAAWGLGELGEPGRAAIERRLRSPAVHSGPVLAELLLAAARLRPVPSGIVIPLLTHTDSAVEWTAAYALARSRVPSGARALAGRAHAASALTRAYVARGLAHGTVGDSLAAVALPVLRDLARDPHPHVRISAARSLATFGARGQAPLLRLAHDGDANVRIAAVQALPPALALSRQTLDTLWRADTSLTFRSAVLTAAARAQASLQPAEAWSRHRDWAHRAAVLDAVAVLPPATAVPLLQRATGDEDARVRAAAVGRLGAFADTGAHVVPALAALRSALTDADWQVRAIALGALARRAPTAHAAAAASALREAQGQAEAGDARVAAIRYLSAAWARDSAAVPPHVLPLLRSIPAPADHAERLTGRASPLFAHWLRDEAAGRGTPRPAEWYEEVARRFALAGDQPIAVIRTTRGTIELALFARSAPLTVENFVRLARSGFYRNASWHRVVPAFVAQDGDPRGDGSGGPGYAIRDEQNAARYERGTLGMALSGPDTGGSQYFITLSPQPHLDGHYTVFGRVLRGLEVLDALVQGDTILSVDVR